MGYFKWFKWFQNNLACVAPRFRYPFRRLSNPTEECLLGYQRTLWAYKICRLSPFISGPCPPFRGGNANISELGRTARRKRQYKRTEPHCTTMNSRAPPHSQKSDLLVHSAARAPFANGRWRDPDPLASHIGWSEEDFPPLSHWTPCYSLAANTFGKINGREWRLRKERPTWSNVNRR